MSLSIQNLTVIIVSYMSDHIIHDCIKSLPNDLKILVVENSNNKSEIIKNKDNEDPVTVVDLKVNELIINRIKEKYKYTNWGILSEENVKIKSNYFDSNVDWLWVLDPLDGTKDFIQGTGNYAMHLALQYQNVPFIGVVLIPEKDELWIANGENVWCERRDGSLVENSISPKVSLNEMTLVTSKNHNNHILEELIKKTCFKKVIKMGSIGCKIASIIRGESDIYISLSLPGMSAPKDWDFAAPEAILKAFGGAITNLNNKELSYNKTNFEQRGIIVACNNRDVQKKVCAELIAIIEKYDLYPVNS